MKAKDVPSGTTYDPEGELRPSTFNIEFTKNFLTGKELEKARDYVHLSPKEFAEKYPESQVEVL